MTTEYLKRQLEKWKRALLLFVGAGLTLAFSMLLAPGPPFAISLGAFIVWIVLQLGGVPAGLLMLFSKTWRQLPLIQRLNTAFGFLGVAWLCWLAIGFGIAGQSSFAFALILLLGALLALLYLLCRRASTHSPEEIFP